jgi:hypothetical protein
VRRLALVLPVALSGCLGYPRPYLTRVHGRAALEDRKPIRIEAAIVKECDTVRGGETSEIVRRRGDTTDKDGRYSIVLWGVTWNFKNFITLSECSSRVQRFICRPECHKADEIDIDLLGK